jgi:hypothetical protein
VRTKQNDLKGFDAQDRERTETRMILPKNDWMILTGDVLKRDHARAGSSDHKTDCWLISGRKEIRSHNNLVLGNIKAMLEQRIAVVSCRSVDGNVASFNQ